MALHVLRRVHHATLQQQGEHAGPLPGLAPVEADPSPNGNAREDLQEPDLGVLVPVADRPAVRRDPPRRPRRRHLAQAQLRRPDRVHGGARRRLAPGQERELAGMGGPHGAHGAARRRRGRRRQRVREGQAGRVAGDQGAEMHLPRVRAGQAVHHDQAAHPGRRRPVRDSQRPAEGRDARRRSRVAGRVRQMVLRLRGGSSKSARSRTAGRATSTSGCGRRGAASPSCAGRGSCSPTSTRRSPPTAPSPRPTTA